MDHDQAALINKSALPKGLTSPKPAAEERAQLALSHPALNLSKNMSKLRKYEPLLRHTKTKTSTKCDIVWYYVASASSSCYVPTSFRMSWRLWWSWLKCLSALCGLWSAHSTYYAGQLQVHSALMNRRGHISAYVKNQLANSVPLLISLPFKRAPKPWPARQKWILNKEQLCSWSTTFIRPCGFMCFLTFFMPRYLFFDIVHATLLM